MKKAPDQEATLPTNGLVATLGGTLGAVIALMCLAWAVDLYRLAGIQFLTEQFLAIVLGLGMALVFVVRPARRSQPVKTHLPWYDAIFAAISLAAGVYIAFNYPTMVAGRAMFRPELLPLLSTWIVSGLLLEALRRSAGWPLVIVVLGFVVFALVGHNIEGDLQTRPVNVNRMVYYLSLDTSGILGLVLLIGVSVVVPFIFFGLLLGASGGASFFNDLSLGAMGRYRGGAAKISVLASSLFGSINGIVVSNILATGVITIPLMKKSGYKPEQAAAIEASASNGGQLLPPVMGAVAFMMADFLQIPYTEVAIAALIPSVLYFIALFVQADLEAARNGILPVPASEIPRALTVIAKGWACFLPFVVLIYALFSMGVQAQTAAIYACVAVMIVGFLIGYGAQRLTLRQVWRSVIETGVSSADILMISAAAGIIMGILQLTGLGFALTMFLVKLGAGNLLLLLVIASFLCILLGMGMPTLGVYVLLAVLICPALIEVGVQPIAAHMFILYLGMMSFVTPPVAIAAFFAANIARGDPMKTSYYSMRFSWTAYIVPFLFVYSPTLLMQGSVGAVLVSVSTAVVGIWFVSAGMIGFGLARMPVGVRVLAITGGALLILPPEMGDWAVVANVLGLAACGVVTLLELARRRNQPRATATS